MRTDTYRIGMFTFRLTRSEEVVAPPFFEQFQSPVDTAYEYRLTLGDDLQEPEGEKCADYPELEVLRTAHGENRRMFEPHIDPENGRKPYAVYKECVDKYAEITLHPDALDELKYDPFFLSLFAMERHQIDHEALILHCCYVKWKGKAILFSAPSGTGKSTQGGLWEQYRSAETINGDKALIRKDDAGTWIADGWPVCGTSGICKIEQLPIGAIVMLSQEKENSVRSLRPIQAFAQLFPQVTVNRWNPAFTTKAMDLIEDLVQTVPIYHLGCTISENAVETLERVLVPIWNEEN